MFWSDSCNMCALIWISVTCEWVPVNWDYSWVNDQLTPIPYSYYPYYYHVLSKSIKIYWIIHLWNKWWIIVILWLGSLILHRLLWVILIWIFHLRNTCIWWIIAILWLWCLILNRILWKRNVHHWWFYRKTPKTSRRPLSSLSSISSAPPCFHQAVAT